MGNITREMLRKFIEALIPTFLSPGLSSNTKSGPQVPDMAIRDPAILTYLQENMVEAAYINSLFLACIARNISGAYIGVAAILATSKCTVD